MQVILEKNNGQGATLPSWNTQMRMEVECVSTLTNLKNVINAAMEDTLAVHGDCNCQLRWQILRRVSSKKL